MSYLTILVGALFLIETAAFLSALRTTSQTHQIKKSESLDKSDRGCIITFTLAILIPILVFFCLWVLIVNVIEGWIIYHAISRQIGNLSLAYIGLAFWGLAMLHLVFFRLADIVKLISQLKQTFSIYFETGEWTMTKPQREPFVSLLYYLPGLYLGYLFLVLIGLL